MIYVDAAKVKDLIAEAGKSDDRFHIHAGISSQAFYRIVFLGGPIQVTTLKKLSSALGVPAASLLDQERMPPTEVASITGDTTRHRQKSVGQISLPRRIGRRTRASVTA